MSAYAAGGAVDGAVGDGQGLEASGSPSSSSVCRKKGIVDHFAGNIRLNTSTGSAETYSSAVTTEPKATEQCHVSLTSARSRLHGRGGGGAVAHLQPRHRAVLRGHDLLEGRVQPHLAATCLDVPLEGLAQPLGLPTVNEGHLQPVVLRRGAAGRHVGNCAVRCPGNRRSVSRAAPR